MTLYETGRKYPCGACRKVTGLRLGWLSPVPCCSEECKHLIVSGIPPEELETCEPPPRLPTPDEEEHR